MGAALEESGKGSTLPCDDQACVSETKEALGATEVILLRVDDRLALEEGFTVEVVFADRESFSLENDNFYLLLEDIRRTVSVALLKEPPTPAEEPESTESAQEEDTTDEPEPAGTKISPTAFWVSLGVTGALIVGSVITETVFHSRYGSMEDEEPWERSQSDWDSLHNLQVFGRVLLGVTALGVVTTAVLFLLTDFEKDEEGKEKTVSLTMGPSAALDGGAVSLEWRF